MPKIAIVIGTRPEGVKMAPVLKALQATNKLEPVVVSTGQHRQMLKQVIDLFDIPLAADLAVMAPNQSLASLTARLMTKVDHWLAQSRPDMVLVQGDTTTVAVTALASFYRNIPVGHVEAGLRMGNLRSPFPEEANRRLTSPLATLHFPPTEAGRQNLLNEGFRDQCITVTGNTVVDALLMEVARRKEPSVAATINRNLAAVLGPQWNRQRYVLITGHRRENFGEGFQGICDALAELAKVFPDHWFIYPVHLNPNVQKPVHQRLETLPNIKLIEPVDYRHFVCLMRQSHLILTDSGGVQEEAPSLGKPILVMRETTERPEGVDAGSAQLVGADRVRIIDAVTTLLTDAGAYRKMSEVANPYGDGQAADRIVARIAKYFNV